MSKIYLQENDLDLVEVSIMNVSVSICLCTTVFYDGHWDIRYIRQCAEKGEVGPDSGRWCKERLGTYRVRVKTCHCDDKDGCNGAATWTLNHTLVIMLTLYILMYLGSRLRCF